MTGVIKGGHLFPSRLSTQKDTSLKSLHFLRHNLKNSFKNKLQKYIVLKLKM